MKKETWKKLKENPKYLISSYGRFFNLRTFKFISWYIDESAGGKLYLRVALSCKNHYVHRLVASNFLKKKNENESEVDHIDDNGLNPHVKNLRWISVKENRDKAGANRTINYRGKILKALNQRKN